MATLRLRDNFAENSWESGITSGTENDSLKKKYKKEKEGRVDQYQLTIRTENFTQR